LEVGVLLGDGGDNVGMKREIAAEENIGDDGCAKRERAMSLYFVCVCVWKQSYLWTSFL